MRKLAKALFLVGSLFLFIVFTGKASAKDSGIYINELMWQGSELSTSDEWVELYNNSSTLVDISGYSLCLLLEDGLCDWEIAITDRWIAPGDHFLISNYAPSDKSILNIESDIVNNDLSLSNSKFKLALYDADKTLVDVAGDGGKPFFPESSKIYQSLQRLEDFSDGTLKSSWSMADKSKNLTEQAVADGVLATPEPSGRPHLKEFEFEDRSFELSSLKSFKFNYVIDDYHSDFSQVKIMARSGLSEIELILEPGVSVFELPIGQCWDLTFNFYDGLGYTATAPESPIRLSCFVKNPQIMFSEILSSSKTDADTNGVIDSQDEWFEIYNGSKTSYDLDGWMVQDAAGKTAKLTGLIAPGGFLVFYYKDSKISLNNTGEDLRLIDPSGEMIDHIEVPKLDYDESYARFDDGWFKTDQPTPFNPNKKAASVVVEQEAQEVIPATNPTQPTVSDIPVNLPQEEEQVIEEVITTYVTLERTVIPATLASSAKTDLAIIQTVQPQVLGSSDYRPASRFISQKFLIYYLASVVIVFLLPLLIFNLYAIYRLE